MCLTAASSDEQGPAIGLLEQGDRFDGRQPALVGIEAPDLENTEATGEGVLETRNDVRAGWLQPCIIDAVGNHPWVHVSVPHLALHVAADRRQGRGAVECRPVDAIEGERVVGVPEQVDVPLPPVAPDDVGKADNRFSRLPLLREDNDVFTVGDLGSN